MILSFLHLLLEKLENDFIMKSLYKYNVSWKNINDILVIDQVGKKSLGIN